MLFKFFIQLIICLSLVNANNFSLAKKSTEEDLGPLDQQANELLQDLRKSIGELSKPSNTLSTNVDIVLEDFEEHLIFIKNKIDINDLEAAAYAMDFLINAVSEVSSSIPSETKLDLSEVKFDELDEEKNEIMKGILTDITSKKINLIKNSIHYSIQLKKSGLGSVDTINKINSLGLGFDQLDDDLTEVDLDLSKVAELDFNELETALASLEEIDMEEVTQEIEERIAESIEIIEEVVEEIAEAVAQTASDVMAEINSTLGTAMSVETYAWLWGIEGVSGSTSFSDAVAIFNESWGTDYTEEETLNLMGYDVCWLHGLCE
jgi:hypothetical protein